MQHKEKLNSRLWSDTEATANEDQRLRAAAALAAYDASGPRWQEIRVSVAQALTRVSPEFLGEWKESLRPVGGQLISPLATIFRNHELGELQLALATSTLADYAADDVGLLADLLCDANPKQFAGLFPVLARHGQAAVRELELELEKIAEPNWVDPPADPKYEDVPAEVRNEIEVAEGLVQDHFAFCQAMPRARFNNVVERLGQCGYRPVRIRPYLLSCSPTMAAIWTRDGRPWTWLSEADADLLSTRDANLRREGYIPVDVAVVCPGPAGGPCFTAVWASADVTDVDVQLKVGPLEGPGQEALAALAAERFNCQVAGVAFDEQGQPHGCSLWTRRKGQQKSTTRVFHGASADFRADGCPGLLMTDVQLSQWVGRDADTDGPLPLTTALWNVSTQFESTTIHGLSPTQQSAQALRLAASGYRPVAVSASAGGERTEAATVWHRPLIAEEAKDRLARRQATAAVALLRLGRQDRVWPLLRHQPDPRTRSYLIHRFDPLGADREQIFRRLDSELEVSVRRALVLVLGEFIERQMPPAERERLAPQLLAMYADDPDPGMHGAVAWTLRRWGRGSDLSAADQKLATGAAVDARRWYVTRQGQKLAVIRGPGEIVIGSPPYEAGREGGPEGDVELQRRVRLDHAFALMTHTVTVAEFLRFRADFYYRDTFSPERDCPINNLNWYEAAAYCNWLNEQEGIPREQWCYLPNEQGEYAQGMRIMPDFLRRTGYRLPTEAEWEFACRAGSITSRYYGQNPDLDNHYAWTVKLALGQGTTSVGRFKPNDFGMFDMMGNIMEWVHDAYHDPGEADSGLGADAGQPEAVSNRQTRVVKPSCYTSTGAEQTRSAAREVRVPPNARILLHALRVGRTWEAAPESAGDAAVRDDQRRVVMGAPVMHSSGFIRSSYRSRGYSPNFRLFAWGLRPARTLGQ